jgi:hypothetical protein
MVRTVLALNTPTVPSPGHLPRRWQRGLLGLTFGKSRFGSRVFAGLNICSVTATNVLILPVRLLDHHKEVRDEWPDKETAIAYAGAS